MFSVTECLEPPCGRTSRPTGGPALEQLHAGKKIYEENKHFGKIKNAEVYIKEGDLILLLLFTCAFVSENT